MNTDQMISNRIDRLFKNKSENILNIYFTAGYPQLEDTKDIMLALDLAGADIIEVGMPYSDPLADGPTIQESGSVALKNGMGLDLLFDQLTQVRAVSQIPMIMMGYYNQVLQYGPTKFLDKCQSIGVDGLILPDLPLDTFEDQYKAAFAEKGIASVFLITPQTAAARIQKINDLSSGFVYMVSSSSITGAKKGIDQGQIEYFERIQSMSLRQARLIGFGISDHQSFSTACKYSNGAIVGSAFIKRLNNDLANETGMERTAKIKTIVQDFVNELRHP